MLNDALEIWHGVEEVQAAAKTWVPKLSASQPWTTSAPGTRSGNSIPK